MATYTSNKGYITQAAGETNWGTALNDSLITFLDRNMGGVATLSLTGATYSMSTLESQQSTLVLSGNPAFTSFPVITITTGITAQSTNIYGFWFVNNKVTLAPGQTQYPEVRIKNPANATYAVIPPNTNVTIISDPTNGVRIAGWGGFVSGTALTFIQAAAPPGWTKSTANDNKALRIVSGSTGGGTGGSTAFTSVFAARTIAQANLPNITLTTDSQGDHTHFIVANTYNNKGGAVNNTQAGASAGSHPSNTSFDYEIRTAGAIAANVGLTNLTGAHTHSVSLGGSATALDFAVQYVDAIICTKD